MTRDCKVLLMTKPNQYFPCFLQGLLNASRAVLLLNKKHIDDRHGGQFMFKCAKPNCGNLFNTRKELRSHRDGNDKSKGNWYAI